jgi:hypothetical protein
MISLKMKKLLRTTVTADAEQGALAGQWLLNGYEYSAGARY